MPISAAPRMVVYRSVFHPLPAYRPDVAIKCEDEPYIYGDPGSNPNNFENERTEFLDRGHSDRRTLVDRAINGKHQYTQILAAMPKSSYLVNPSPL